LVAQFILFVTCFFWEEKKKKMPMISTALLQRAKIRTLAKKYSMPSIEQGKIYRFIHAILTSCQCCYEEETFATVLHIRLVCEDMGLGPFTKTHARFLRW